MAAKKIRAILTNWAHTGSVFTGTPGTVFCRWRRYRYQMLIKKPAAIPAYMKYFLRAARSSVCRSITRLCSNILELISHLGGNYYTVLDSAVKPFCGTGKNGAATVQIFSTRGAFFPKRYKSRGGSKSISMSVRSQFADALG